MIHSIASLRVSISQRRLQHVLLFPILLNGYMYFFTQPVSYKYEVTYARKSYKSTMMVILRAQQEHVLYHRRTLYTISYSCECGG